MKNLPRRYATPVATRPLSLHASPPQRGFAGNNQLASEIQILILSPGSQGNRSLEKASSRSFAAEVGTNEDPLLISTLMRLECFWLYLYPSLILRSFGNLVEKSRG